MTDKLRRRVAGIQTHVEFSDTRANLAKMIAWMNHEAVAGCHLIVFPECMLPGYCFDSLEEAWPHAETIPGPATNRIAEECQRLTTQYQKTFVAFGMLERAGDGILHNSCALVGPDGLVGVYRKVHLPYLGVDRFVARGPDPFQVHEIDGMKIGMHICYDGSFPEASRAMALDGADLLILPTNWPPGADTFAKYLPNARALENNVYFLAVNRVGVERGFRFIGQSRLCDTNGNSMVDGPEEGESILVAEIDLLRARNKQLVRVPGKHVIDRFADRQPAYYGKICESHHLVRELS